MTYTGHISNGLVVFDTPPPLVDGTVVEVRVREPGPVDALGWPVGFHDRMFGCITDETFVAPPRGLPRGVSSLDGE